MMSHIYKRVEYTLYNALTTILLRKRFFSGVFLNSYVGSSRAIVNEKNKEITQDRLYVHVHSGNVTSFAFDLLD